MYNKKIIQNLIKRPLNNLIGLFPPTDDKTANLKKKIDSGQHFNF